MDVERRKKEASALRALFHEQWLHFLKLLGVNDEDISVEHVRDLPVGDAIDEIVEGTDARVRAIYNYQDALRSGVRKLLGHIDSIAERLAGPIKLSRKNFVYDPQASSLLGSMEEVKRLCDENEEVQRFIRTHCSLNQGSFFALLFMHYHEKEIFGDELRGDFIHRDVRQTSVFFTGHRLMAPAASEFEVRSALRHILLEDVVEYLKLLLSRERQNETGIREIHSLTESMRSLSNPYRYLDELVTILELPIDLISLEENTVCVNKMGIKITGSDRPYEEIHLQEIEIGGNHNNLLALVEITFSDIN